MKLKTKQMTFKQFRAEWKDKNNNVFIKTYIKV